MKWADTAEGLVARAETDPALCEFVAQIREVRFSHQPESFERLLWLLAAQGMCFGARMALEHIVEERRPS